jgi:DNA-binding response OmpR family regulator
MAGIQILVVEHDATQSKLARFVLEEAGHQVQLAESAEEALEVLQTFHPDLILTDLQLPGKDGLELTRALRLDPIYARTPIIALTAYSNSSDLAKARESGCNGNISKPIDTAAFARQVRSHFGTAGAYAFVPSDGGDLLADMRNRFLAEGLDDCGTVLRDIKALKSISGGVIDKVLRVLHRWASVGGTLGFPEIANQARRTEALITSLNLDYEQAIQAIESAQRRFAAATSFEPELPLALIKGLMHARVGLVNFSEQEAERIQKAAKRANLQAVIERMDGKPLESRTAYGALVINECAFLADAAQPGLQWRIPAVFVVSRSSLESLSALSSRVRDFMIAPWEAEEVLLRVHRLIASAAPSQPTGESLGMARRRPRVLIADDDPDLVALVSATLGQSGMDCEIARGGKQAMEAVRKHPPDAIVLDVNMTDLDGFEVLKELRHNLATRAIPVLMLTARSQQSDIARGAGSGADDYVVKPFDPLDLVTRLNTIIAASHKPPVPR